MTPLPTPLGGGELVAWRLDQARYAPSWDTGEGAWLYGGRWSPRGQRVVHCSIDPAAAIIEVAVHTGFAVLDTAPHVLTAITVTDWSDLHVVQPGDVPNPNWLRPGIPSAGQQQFGGRLLGEHAFVLFPSTVSTHSWNLLFDPAHAAASYELRLQEPFALDPRLHPPGRQAP